MAGVLYTQRPDLFNAVVVGAPLLDMKRYSKLLAGASWIGEYGDPDIPEEWDFIKKYSPYHNLKSDSEYRIQSHHRILENHGNPVSSDFPHPGISILRNFIAFKINTAVGYKTGFTDQINDGKSGD